MSSPTVTPDLTNSLPSPTNLPAGSTPPAPDLSAGTSPMPSGPAPGGNTLFRSILAGALAGMAAGSRAKTFGQGLVAGAAGGLDQQQRNFENQQTQQRTNAVVDQAKAETAYHMANVAKINHDLHLMAPDRQSALLDESIDQTNTLVKAGAVEPIGPATSRGDAQQQVLDLYSKNPALTYSVVPVRGEDGGISWQAVQYPKAPLKQDVVLKGLGPDGKDLTVPAGTDASAVGKYYSAVLAKRMDTEAKTQLENQKQTGRVQIQGMKNDAAAARANNKQSSDWRPGVGADEKKKAELAENIAFNSSEVAKILLKRPGLVGAVSGRYTNVEQMIGNNDPDISALGTHIHNIAMANSGVHGFRSQEGVKSYEQQLLNNFKNGPQAVAGALKASTSSVQTFIDNARPDTYKTHSKQGGAVRGMLAGGQ